MKLPERIISYSLYGNNNIYQHGMVENCIIAKNLFPNWCVWIYYNDTIDEYIVNVLKSFDNVKLIHIFNDEKSARNTMWRFLPMFDETNIVISRDADSRLCDQDVTLVENWLNSTYDFHICRTNKKHFWPVIASTFGCRNGCLSNYKHIYDDFYQTNDGWYIDQKFLKEIYNLIPQGNILAHSCRQRRDSRCKFNNETKVAISNEDTFIGKTYSNYVTDYFENLICLMKHLKT